MIGGQNISDLNLRTLRRGITVIPQEPMLISESIRYVTVKSSALILKNLWNHKLPWNPFIYVFLEKIWIHMGNTVMKNVGMF